MKKLTYASMSIFCALALTACAAWTPATNSNFGFAPVMANSNGVIVSPTNLTLPALAATNLVKRSGDTMAGALSNSAGFYGPGAGLTGFASHELNAATSFIFKTGGTMTGSLTNDAGLYGDARGMTNLAPQALNGATSFVAKTGDIMSGNLTISNTTGGLTLYGEDTPLIKIQCSHTSMAYLGWNTMSGAHVIDFEAQGNFGGWRFVDGPIIPDQGIQGLTDLTVSGVITSIGGGFFVFDEGTNFAYAFLDPSGLHVGTNSFIVDIGGDITEVGNIDLCGNTISNGAVIASSLALGTNASVSDWPVTVETDPIWSATGDVVSAAAAQGAAAWAWGDHSTNGYATGDVVRAETDPVWTNDRADYATLAGGTLGTNAENIAIGKSANGDYTGAAIGSSANGSGGAGIGYNANGGSYGVAVGYQANGYNFGIALGRQAVAPENIAIGSYAVATGLHRSAIGSLVTNQVDESVAIRGTLYLDGGTAVMARTSFGSGDWSQLIQAGGDYIAEVNGNGTNTTLDAPRIYGTYQSIVDVGEGVMVTQDIFHVILFPNDVGGYHGLGVGDGLTDLLWYPYLGSETGVVGRKVHRDMAGDSIFGGTLFIDDGAGAQWGFRHNPESTTTNSLLLQFGAELSGDTLFEFRTNGNFATSGDTLQMGAENKIFFDTANTQIIFTCAGVSWTNKP